MANITKMAGNGKNMALKGYKWLEATEMIENG